MWGSAFLDDSFQIIKSNPIPKEQPIRKNMFSITGEGWFETHLGCSAADFVDKLRKMRRSNKESKIEIDTIIEDVRTLKALEDDFQRLWWDIKILRPLLNGFSVNQCARRRCRVQPVTCG